tara:strand:+ start:600 stop:716 length:117 start_codon:yes stop_codon:yes gene_type:complete
MGEKQLCKFDIETKILFNVTSLEVEERRGEKKRYDFII